MKLHVQPTLGCELEEDDDEEEESSEEGPFFGSGSTRSLSLIAMKPIASFSKCNEATRPSLWSFLWLIKVVYIIFEHRRCLSCFYSQVRIGSWSFVFDMLATQEVESVFKRPSL